MSAPGWPGKPHLTPEVVRYFADYKARPGNGAWGALHIVLEDDNVDDASVLYCLTHTAKTVEEKRLAKLLLCMSRSQRLRLDRKVAQFLARGGRCPG